MDQVIEKPRTLPFIAYSGKMQSILANIEMIAASDHSILLIGETGTGKELLAEYIHRLSPRGAKPMVKVSLSALPHELLESELFGHEKGAFTSATSEKRGLFEIASGGTIFLDDIDDVPLTMQTKLLRVLESREMMRVGGTVPIAIDVRVISASKTDLKELVDREMFRVDLFYRLNVVPIELPPLRERTEDIPHLISHFLRRFAPGRPITITPAAIRVLTEYRWPGNIRELRNVVQRITLVRGNVIDANNLPIDPQQDHPLELLVKPCSTCANREGLGLDQAVACLETHLIEQALQQAGGNRMHAARILKMNPSTFRDKLKKYHLD